MAARSRSPQAAARQSSAAAARGGDLARRRPLPSSTPSRFASRTFSSYSGLDRSTAEQQQSGERARLRPQETIHEGRRKKLLVFARLSLLQRAVLVMVLCGLLWFSASSAMVQGDPMVIAADDTTTTEFLQADEVYARFAMETVGGGLDRLKWRVDTAAVREALLDVYPELYNVRVSVPVFGGQLKLTLTPAAPSLLLSVDGGASSSWVLSSTGKVMSDDVNKATNVPMLIDSLDTTITYGQRLVTSDEMATLQYVLDEFTRHELVVSTVTLPAIPGRFHVRLSDTTYDIYFTFKHDIAQQVGAYLVTREHLLETGETPAAYVDARIADRVYVK